MEIYFFIDWILKNGKENYEKIVDKVCKNAPVPADIMMKEPIYKTAYRLKVLYITYIIATLQFFDLNENQISFVIGLLLEHEEYKSMNPREILECQKEAIADMKVVIEKDFTEFTR